MFIYLIVNHITGKYYVGQHKGNSLKKYLQDKFSRSKTYAGSSHLFNSMRKYGREAFTIHALLSDIQTKIELDQKEKDFIEFLRSRDPEYGYNICHGGEGFTGTHSEASRKKMSESAKKEWQDSPERRKQMSARMLGNPHEGCLIPHEARIRGGHLGGSIKSETKTEHCKLIASAGGKAASQLLTFDQRSKGGKLGSLAQPLESKVKGGLKGGQATASKPGFLAEISRIASCKHWQIGRGKPCICGNHQ